MFVIWWILPVLVLITLYAGTLTAVLARPKMPSAIRNAEALLSQKEISLVVEEGSFMEFYLKTAPPGSTRTEMGKIMILDHS